MQSAWHNPFQALSSGLSQGLTQGLSQGLADEIAKGLPEGLSQAELEEWNNQLKEIGEQYQGLMQDLLSRIAPSEAADSIYSDMRESFEAGAQSLMQNPTLLWETQARLVQDQWMLWQQAMRGMAGEQVTPLITPAKNDRRFKDEAWTQDPHYMAIMQQYLLFSQMVEDLVEILSGLD